MEWKTRGEKVERREFFPFLFSRPRSLSLLHFLLLSSLSAATCDPGFPSSVPFPHHGCRRARDQGGRAVLKGRDRREKGLGRQGNRHRDEPWDGLRRRFQGLSFEFLLSFSKRGRFLSASSSWGSSGNSTTASRGWMAEAEQRQTLWWTNEGKG